MQPMNKLKFCSFIDFEEGKMARMETTGEHEIPINIVVDNIEEIKESPQGYCYMDVYGIGIDIEVYASEEAYMANSPSMDKISMIPIGTFSVDPEDESFEQSPLILFAGKVLDVAWNPKPNAEEDNCCALVETLGLLISLSFQCDQPLEKGAYIHGTAWLCGDLRPLDAAAEM